MVGRFALGNPADSSTQNPLVAGCRASCQYPGCWAKLSRSMVLAPLIRNALDQQSGSYDPSPYPGVSCTPAGNLQTANPQLDDDRQSWWANGWPHRVISG